MPDGTWTTTGTKATATVAGFVIVGVAVLGALFLPLILAVVHVVWVVLSHLWAAMPYLLAYELAVVVSAVLDWSEARLATTSRKQAWLVAHGTVWARAWRRLGWITKAVKVAVGQLAKPVTPGAVEAPRFEGVLIEVGRHQMDDEPATKVGAA